MATKKNQFNSKVQAKLHANKQIKSVLQSWNKIKGELSHYVSDRQLKQIQSAVKNFIRNAKRDINGLVGKDVAQIKNRINRERKQLERLIDQVIRSEIKRAKSFVTKQKKELSKLQKKVESLVPLKKKKTAPRRTSVKKKTTKKSTKKSTRRR